MKRLSLFVLFSLSLALFTGCAASAATAGYSLKSQCADSLTSEAESRIVERAKREMMAELSGNGFQNN